MKFGGTSVADAEAMSRVIGILRRHLESNPGERPPVVVVSALSKVTDRLIEAGRLAGNGEADEAAMLLSALLDRHLGVASALVGAEALRTLAATLTEEFSSVILSVRALAASRDVSLRSHDEIVAMGELASSRIVAAAFASAKI